MFAGGGLVMIVLGKNKIDAVNSLSATDDFDYLGADACEITTISASTTTKERCTRHRKDTNGNSVCDNYVYDCYDTYTFNFKAADGSDNAASSIYTGFTQEVKRSPAQECSGDSGKRDASYIQYAVGDKTGCWKPDGNPSELSSLYKCNNAECYKLIDPQDDLDGHKGKGVMFVGIGSACVALALIVGFCFATGRCKSSSNGANNGGGDNGGMTPAQMEMMRRQMGGNGGKGFS
jgi:hypothetical protein